MAGTFNFIVVAPDGQVLNQDVEFVIVPGEDGELGVLPNHAPLIAGLGIGVIRYTDNAKVRKIAVSGGFMEVFENKVTVLAGSAETSEKINIERAQAAKERAEKRLGQKLPETDVARAEIALKKAIARLRAVEK